MKTNFSKSLCWFGSDPEFFILNAENKVVPAEKFLPPEPKYKAPTQNYLFYDGVQGEINIPADPCREYFTTHLRGALKKLNASIPDDHRITFCPSVKIDPKSLEECSELTRIVGCNPDKNAYDETPSQAARRIQANYAKWPHRECGGHLSFGLELPDGYFDEEDLEACSKRIVKAFDVTLGILGVLLSPWPEEERLRRLVFGRAGCYRTRYTEIDDYDGWREPTYDDDYEDEPIPWYSWVIEYRTLSSFWMQAPWLGSLLTGIGRQVIASYDQLDPILELSDECREIINSNDQAKARAIFGKVFKLMLNGLKTCGNYDGIFQSTKETAFLLELIEKGDIIANIDLNTEWACTNSYGDPLGWLGKCRALP